MDLRRLVTFANSCQDSIADLLVGKMINGKVSEGDLCQTFDFFVVVTKVISHLFHNIVNQRLVV